MFSPRLSEEALLARKKVLYFYVRKAAFLGKNI